MRDLTHRLAIVIPAFKRPFFRQSLDSIAAQTDQRFHAYVCDDASMENLEEVFHNSSLAQLPNATYFQFSDNLGSSALVQQWNRSVRQTSGEEWVWLFSDDDVMDPRCVAAFYRALSASQEGITNVYRFNTLTIDSEGDVIEIAPPHPPFETAAEFAYHRMANQRLSYAPNYVFRRAAFDKHNGFVEFPFAMGSDDASWIRFSENVGIRTIEDAYVFFRASGTNTSSLATGRAVEKFCAVCDYAAWLRNEFAARSPLPKDMSSKIDLSKMAASWWLLMLRRNTKLLSPTEIRRLAIYGSEKLGLPAITVLSALLKANLGIAACRVRRFVS